MISIGIIEDDSALRKSMEEFIALDQDLFLLFSFNSIEKWLTHLENERSEPFLLFLDIGLPGISGLQAMSTIRKAYPESRLVIISGDNADESVWKAMTGGANGYLLKPFSLVELKRQVQVIKTGGAILSPHIAGQLIRQISNRTPEHDELSALTHRENEVMEQLIKGLSYKEVSHILGITAATVNDHIKKIYTKLHVKSKSELVSKIMSRRTGQNIQ